jgi:hypothetical protein
LKKFWCYISPSECHNICHEEWCLHQICIKKIKLTAYAPIHVIISYAQRCFLQVNTRNAATQQSI